MTHHLVNDVSEGSLRVRLVAAYPTQGLYSRTEVPRYGLDSEAKLRRLVQTPASTIIRCRASVALYVTIPRCLVFKRCSQTWGHVHYMHTISCALVEDSAVKITLRRFCWFPLWSSRLIICFVHIDIENPWPDQKI